MRIRSLLPTGTDGPALLALCRPALDVVTPDVLCAVDRALAATKAASRRDDVQVVLAEAINNIAEHAYAEQDFGALALRILLNDTVLTIQLTDWGGALPDDQAQSAPPPVPTNLSEGGYGWFLIRTLTSVTSYSRVHGQNRLTLEFELF